MIAARLEDTHVRNPLNPPVRLDIPMDGSPVDLLSSQITLDVTDSSLYQLYGELYEEVGLLVKLVHQGTDTDGRSAVIHYYDTGAKMEARAGGRLGNPPDYLIPVLFAEDAKKVREGTLVIYADGEARSEPLRLTFDENGHCEQGRFLVVEVR